MVFLFELERELLARRRRLLFFVAVLIPRACQPVLPRQPVHERAQAYAVALADVVAARVKGDLVLKRVIALPGEWVEMRVLCACRRTLFIDCGALYCAAGLPSWSKFGVRDSRFSVLFCAIPPALPICQKGLDRLILTVY